AEPVANSALVTAAEPVETVPEDSAAGGGLPQRRPGPPAKPFAAGAAGVTPGRKRPDDGGTSRLACPAVRPAAGRAKLGVGRGHFVPAETLGEAHAVSSSGRRPAG